MTFRRPPASPSHPAPGPGAEGAAWIGRRGALGLLAGGIATTPLLGCDGSKPWHDIDVTGTSPSLSFALQRAPDGKRVTQADYRGLTTLLYFGYTYCPDVCPLTLQNVDTTFDRMGKLASQVRLLFVTVDPTRDTLEQLAKYVGLFGPNFVGLRGSADQLERLAQRYRIAYSVTPPGRGHGYEVTHSSVIYAFDRDGNARLLVPSMASSTPDISGFAADLRRLVTERGSFSRWIEEMV